MLIYYSNAEKKILFHPSKKKSFEFAILIHSFKSFSKIWIINHILALYFELFQLASIFASFSRCLFFVCSLNLINKFWYFHFWSNTELQETRKITTDLLNSTKQNAKTLWAQKNFTSTAFLSSKFEWKAMRKIYSPVSKIEKRICVMRINRWLVNEFHLSCQRESGNSDFDLHTISMTLVQGKHLKAFEKMNKKKVGNVFPQQLRRNHLAKPQLRTFRINSKAVKSIIFEFLKDCRRF